jgi:hypothetical protein
MNLVSGTVSAITGSLRWVRGVYRGEIVIHSCKENAAEIDRYYTDWQETETSVCTRYVKHQKVVRRCDVCGNQWTEKMPEEFDKVEREWK